MWKKISAKVLMFLVGAVLCVRANRVHSTDVITGEYCQEETMEASCPEGELMLMVSGQYGRAQIGKCVKKNLGYVGCASNVLRLLDTFCSGRRSCSVSVMNPALRLLKPCIQDVSWHLEASYRCIQVHSSPESTCHSHKQVTLTDLSGYLSSYQSGQSRVGTSDCPWHIKAKPGQKINITAFNFIGAPLIGDDDEGRAQDNKPVCYQFATVTEGYNKRMLTVCVGAPRIQQVYLSTTHELKLEFMERRSSQHQTVQFLIEYKVQGCANLEPASKSMWVKRTGDDVHVKCNKSGESWYLTCSGNTWRGQVGNCSDGAHSTAAKRDEWKIDNIFGTGSDFPIGILIIVSVGVALGVFLGGTLLIVVALHMKRKRRAKAARAACLDPGYLSSDTMEKSRHSVPMYDPDAQDPYNMPKDCGFTPTAHHHHHHHHSTDTLDIMPPPPGKQQAVEYTSDGRCTTTATTTCHMPPPYGGGQQQQQRQGQNTPASRLYESPKVSL